jgi:hypothetical protein
LQRKEGDEEISCDVCLSEDCTAGYYNCKRCKSDFCLECCNKAIVEKGEIAVSKVASWKDYNAEMRPED